MKLAYHLLISLIEVLELRSVPTGSDFAVFKFGFLGCVRIARVEVLGLHGLLLINSN